MQTRHGIPVIVLIGLLLLPLATVGQEASPNAATPEASEQEWPRLSDRIVYGEDDPSKQALYVWELEPRDTPRPALVYVHGGALAYGDARDAAPLLGAFAESGYVTFSIGYRLFIPGIEPTNLWPSQLDDVQMAMRWIREHATEYNVDPNRICVMGHSSGGHLAGLLGTLDTRDPETALYPGKSSRADCVISISGDLDITVPYINSSYTDLNETIFHGTLESRPEVYQAASPAYNVDGNTVPFLIIHSSIDGDTPVQQARNMVAALGEAGVPLIYAEFPDQSHSGILSHEPVGPMIDEFLAWQLHPEE